MYGGLKIAAVPYFKLISQAEKNYSRLNITCVLIEIGCRHACRTNTSKICYCCSNLSVSCAMAS
jgi:hypothetical protein